MFAHLTPHSSDFGDIYALYSPFLDQLTMQSSLFEPRALQPCPSYCRRRDRINLGLLRSLYKGGGVGFRGLSAWCRRWPPETRTVHATVQYCGGALLGHRRCHEGGGHPLASLKHSSQRPQLCRRQSHNVHDSADAIRATNCHGWVRALSASPQPRAPQAVHFSYTTSRCPSQAYIRTADNHRRTPPPPRTKVTIVQVGGKRILQ